MRRSLFPLVAFFAVGCSDSLPQLMNEAAQTKAEFVDKLMLVTDEESCDRHYKRAEKALQDRTKEIEERIAKAAYNLSFDSIENAIKKATQKAADPKAPPVQIKAGAALTKMENWVAQAMILMEAMQAKKDYIIADHFTEARLAREKARLRSLEAALGPGKAPKISAMNSSLAGDKKNANEGPIPQGLNFLKGVPPQELFMPADFFNIKFDVINLPPPPRYVGGPGGADPKDPLEQPKDKNKKYENVDLALNQAEAILQHFKRAQNPTRLREGIPHPSKEAGAHAAEKLKGNVRTFRDLSSGYNATTDLKGNDATTVIGLLGNSLNYKGFTRNKAPGYHADWALDFTVPALTLEAYISGSTDQIHLVLIEDTPTKNTTYNLKCDLGQGAADQLKNALRPYRKLRPAPGP